MRSTVRPLPGTARSGFVGLRRYSTTVLLMPSFSVK
jgi:hypothetical protein